MEDLSEEFSMSKKILSRLESIFLNDPNLVDFSIVATDDNSKNKSPVLYEDHHLGLESWCIKYIYRHVCSELFKIRGMLRKRKLSCTMLENINQYLIGALLINPDVTTFWNMKRELVEIDHLNTESELFFSKIVLTRKGKSNEAFAYRRWLISRLLEKIIIYHLEPPPGLFENEFSVVAIASENSPNNYHSWTHRIWCIENFSAVHHNFEEMVLSELDFSEIWLEQHVSEHSGYHYREYLINKIGQYKCSNLLGNYYCQVMKRLRLYNDDEPTQFLDFLLGKQCRKLIEDSFRLVNYLSLLLYELFFVIEKLNRHFPGHESLWLHRQFVIYHLLKTAHEYHCLEFKCGTKIEGHFPVKNIINSESSGEKQRPNKVSGSSLYKILSDSEKEFLNNNSNTENSLVQINFAKRYEKWLDCVLGVSFLH